jgi:hypothetical protein
MSSGGDSGGGSGDGAGLAVEAAQVARAVRALVRHRGAGWGLLAPAEETALWLHASAKKTPPYEHRPRRVCVGACARAKGGG